MTQRARFEVRSAWLGRDFGEAYARRVFGDAVVDALPRKSRGPNKGAHKAEIVWVKCTEGGWVSTSPCGLFGGPVGRVERRGGATVISALRVDGEIVQVSGDFAYRSLLR